MPIEMSGMKELLANLDAVSKNVQNVRGRALEAGAEVIRKSASEKCPRGKASRNLAKKYSPGQHLADNIVVSQVYAQNGMETVDVGPLGGANNDFFYGKFLEFGTSRMTAQPFMEPALIEKREEAFATMANIIREAISDAQR